MLKKLKNKIVVSCQASKNDPTYAEECLMGLVKSAIKGGAGGLRLAGERDITNTRAISNLPIIGITKPDPLPENWKDIVYITPGYTDAQKIAKAGADIIAIDGTARQRPSENLEELIHKIKNELNKLVMADISTLEEGIMCEKYGTDVISTTLSGYTTHTLSKNTDEPDFALLEQLIKTLHTPIILEGRVWTPEHVKKAFELGAHAVVIGSAITRPELITKRFVNIIK